MIQLLLHQVRLIAVDSNGVPVTEPAILQAAAEQAGIVFLVKDENNKDTQITIHEAMQVCLSRFKWLVVYKKTLLI